MSTASDTRSLLLKSLNALPPQQFNQLLFDLNPPAGVVPPMPAPQGDRTFALLSWAEGPTGCGLEQVQQTLDSLPKSSVVLLRLGGIVLKKLRTVPKRYLMLTSVSIVVLLGGTATAFYLNPDLTKLIPALSQMRAEDFFHRGLENYKRGNKQAAIDEFSKAMDLKPDYAEAYYQRGITLYELGDKQAKLEAINDFSQAIILKPDYAEAYYQRGIIRYDVLKDPQTAYDDFEQTIKHNQKYAEAYYRRGLIRYERKQENEVREAIKDFTTAIQYKDKSYSEAYFYRGKAYDFFKEYQNAVNDYSQVIQAKQDYVEAYIERAESYKAQGKSRYELAIADFSEVIKRKPSSDILARRGYTYYSNNNFEAAIENFTQAIELNHEWGVWNIAEAYNSRAGSYYALKKWRAALSDYTSAINADTKNSLYYAGRGDVYYYQLGDKEKAIADYSQVITIQANSGAYFSRGRAYSDLGNKELAIADFSKAIESAKRDEFKSEAYYYRGNARSDIGDKKGALTDYSSAQIWGNEYDADAAYQEGVVRSELGDKDSAISSFESAAEYYLKKEQLQKRQEALNRISQLKATSKPVVKRENGSE